MGGKEEEMPEKHTSLLFLFLEVNLGEDKGPEREKGRALALDKQTREKGDWSGTKEGSTVGVSCVIAVH